MKKLLLIGTITLTGSGIANSFAETKIMLDQKEINNNSLYNKLNTYSNWKEDSFAPINLENIVWNLNKDFYWNKLTLNSQRYWFRFWGGEQEALTEAVKHFLDTGIKNNRAILEQYDTKLVGSTPEPKYEETLNNYSDSPQKLLTRSQTYSYTDTYTFSHKWTHTVNVKTEFNFSFFKKFELNYTYSDEKQVTNTHTETQTLQYSGQTYEVPPHHQGKFERIIYSKNYENNGILRFNVPIDKQGIFVDSASTYVKYFPQKLVYPWYSARDVVNILKNNGFKDYLIKGTAANKNSVITVDNINNPSLVWINVPLK